MRGLELSENLSLQHVGTFRHEVPVVATEVSESMVALGRQGSTWFKETWFKLQGLGLRVWGLGV